MMFGIDTDTLEAYRSDMNLDELMADPEFRAESDRLTLRHRRATWLTGWMRRIPVLGAMTQLFWYCVLTEGFYQTCKPRWGAITFSFLNDGYKPTLWHTIRQVTRDHTDPYTGVYVSGAPRSLAEAETWERQ